MKPSGDYAQLFKPLRIKKSFDCLLAQGGQEGLQVLKNKSNISIIISDLMMPHMDGIEFLGSASKISPDTVRIMLTGHATLDRAIEAVNEGHIFMFLTKPIDNASLSKALDRAIGQYELVKSQQELRVLRRLKAAFTSVVSGLATVVETRDRYTAGHQARVANLAVLIAEHMELSKNQLEAVKLAALVHDIGKIYVPAEFLCKTGELSSDEMNIIRAHTTVGHKILAPMDFEWPISEIVLQHHESLDGKGYPRGLIEKDILIEARIIRVADTVDAVLSDRPYRRGAEESLTLNILKEGTGSDFDERVVNALLAIASRSVQNGGLKELLGVNVTN